MADTFVIVNAKRTPFGKYLGALSETEPIDVAVHAANAALTSRNADLKPHIDQIFVGNCMPMSFKTASVTGRQVALRLGLDVFTTTLDTACCSPLTALRMALWGLRLGEISSALIIGIDSLSRVPHVSHELRTGVRIGEVKMPDAIYPIGYPDYNPVAVDAADGADKYKIPKRMLDSWAMGSHVKWANANSAGKFKEELAPMMVRKGREKFRFQVDESPRPSGSLAAIEQLPTVFGAKTTTCR